MHVIKNTFLWKVSASLVKLLLVTRKLSPWRILVFFSIRGDKRIGLIKISSREYLTIWKSVVPGFWEPRCLTSALHPELHQGVLEVSSYSSTWFNPCRDRWQAPMASASLLTWVTSDYRRVSLTLSGPFRLMVDFGSCVLQIQNQTNLLWNAEKTAGNKT